MMPRTCRAGNIIFGQWSSDFIGSHLFIGWFSLPLLMRYLDGCFSGFLVDEVCLSWDSCHRKEAMVQRVPEVMVSLETEKECLADY